MHVELECGLEDLVVEARRLLAVDPERFVKLLTLCRAYLSIYEMPHESLTELTARLTTLPVGVSPKPSA